MAEAALNVNDLVPHSGEIVLIDVIDHVEENALQARTTVRDDGLFNSTADAVPAFMAVEYMAQAIAAWAGWRGSRSAEPVKPGLLLGARDFSADTPNLSVGTELAIEIERVLEMANGLGVFDCSVKGEGVAVTARLSVLTVDSLEELNARGLQQ